MRMESFRVSIGSKKKPCGWNCCIVPKAPKYIVNLDYLYFYYYHKNVFPIVASFQFSPVPFIRMIVIRIKGNKRKEKNAKTMVIR